MASTILKLQIALGLAAGVALGGITTTAIVGVAYYNLSNTLLLRSPETITTNSMVDFTARAYMMPDQWLWHPEARGISRSRAEFAPQYTPALSVILTGIRYQKTTQQAAIALLQWYEANQKLVGRFFPSLTMPKPFCDEDAAAFRAMLMRMGIQSRVVNFQYEDGDGGKAHTALEVWLPDQQRWVYTDPHYMAYADATAVEVMGNPSLLTLLRPENKEALLDTFTNGAREFLIEGHTPRHRIRLLQ